MISRVAAPVAPVIPGLAELWAQTQGDPRICVAVLDGPVDRSHPCFDGALLTSLPTLVPDVAGPGRMSAHGTHVASMIFGQPNSPVRGIAPGCRGAIATVFSDQTREPTSQSDLARAINQAVEAGAHVVNISGGELTRTGQADPMLVDAVRHCRDRGVLIVAAAGNDACRCLHVPAALPSVLAVGAMDEHGMPLGDSNWGDAYQTQGVLAPGYNMPGAVPGGGTTRKCGTSYATPVVSGTVALLLSWQLARGDRPDPLAMGQAILNSADPCPEQSFFLPTASAFWQVASTSLRH
jgi:cyanobactin maturation PatA/PatG family protease